jgi:hypothetical protein
MTTCSDDYMPQNQCNNDLDNDQTKFEWPTNPQQTLLRGVLCARHATARGAVHIGGPMSANNIGEPMFLRRSSSDSSNSSSNSISGSGSSSSSSGPSVR